MKKAILLFVLLLTMSFTFASNGLVEKSSVFNGEDTISNAIEFTQVNFVLENDSIISQANLNTLVGNTTTPANGHVTIAAPDSIWVCRYLGGGWWHCRRVVVVIVMQ